MDSNNIVLYLLYFIWNHIFASSNLMQNYLDNYPWRITYFSYSITDCICLINPYDS